LPYPPPTKVKGKGVNDNSMENDINSQKEPKEGIDKFLDAIVGEDKFLDTIKQSYEHLKKISDPILQKQILEFELFYNDELKHQKLSLEIDEIVAIQTEDLRKSDYGKYITESGKIRSTIFKSIGEREGFDIDRHRAKDMEVRTTFRTWIELFIIAEAPIQQGATMFKLTSDLLNSQAVSLRSDIPINDKIPFNDLSKEEKTALYFNIERPLREYWTKKQMEILKPFKSKFEGIPLDLDLINKIEERKSHQEEEKKKVDAGNGENLIFKNLSELFSKTEDFEFAISVLKNVEKPVIGDDDNYLLGKNSKGVFTAWIDILHKKSLIKTNEGTIIAPLLETYFKRLTITDRTLRANPTVAYNRYYTDFTTLFSSRVSS
jgi:hypothetical protein